MKTEEQVWSALVDSNPVPDADAFGRQTVDDAAHLAAHSDGSSDLTQPDTSSRETNLNNLSIGRWLAAAALIVVAGIAITLVNQGQEETPFATTPTTSADTVPTTVPEASPTTVERSEDQWESIPVWNGGIEPDSYRSEVFFVPFSFDVPGRWWPRGSELQHFIDMSSERGDIFNPSTVGLTLIDWGLSDVESTSASIRSDPAVSFSDTTPVDVGGASGVTFTASRSGTGSGDVYLIYDDPEPNCSRRDCGEGVLLLAGDTSMVFYVVDVNGSTVTIVITDRPGGSFTELAQSVVDSITWRDLP